ncbi:MAG: hypothetical protein HY393_01255 [Candidatus Diapherotrites archaeon]|nr:hypothetical protein [Candidatus Diapherotrites archaeon]
MDILLQTLWNDIRIALTLFVLIWVYSWAKGSMGNARMAILFAIVIVFLTVYNHPELLWFGVALFFLATFGKEIFAKVNVFKEVK